MSSSLVEFHSGSIWINGQPKILLTSSLFYFRIPSAEWRSRMYTLRTLGYNAVDVYFPWNFHELEPGQWSFSGERDVRVFLQMAKEVGLWVVARPGPYICSEWDGGSLPAYLNAKTGLKLRDNDSEYLLAVKGWYDQIMPILADYQVDHSGTVVMLQIENELDFFDCSDRPGMMASLRDMARAHGIRVPLVTCSGEGDLPGATGGVDGVVPVCNVYFDSCDPKVEMRIRHYEALVREQGLPLCIMETNRSHTDLRRLMAGGAKLLGPYLQTGGTDFGFTTGVTNWGDPLAFMTSQYDFGGMISPGGKVRREGGEAIPLTKMVAALGPALALSTPEAIPPLGIHGIKGQALALDGGGWLVGLPNLGQKTVSVRLGEGVHQFPRKTVLNISPNTCPFILLDYPLTRLGWDTRICYSTAELVECNAHDQTLDMTFAVEGAAELMLEWPDSSSGDNSGWQLELTQAGWCLSVEGSIPAQVEFKNPEGKHIIVKAIDRSALVDLHLAGLNARQVAETDSDSKEFELPHLDWDLRAVDPCSPLWSKEAVPCKPGKLHLEQNGIYRGFAWYRTTGLICDNLKGLLVQSGADILSLYMGGQFLGTLIPGGGDAFLPLPEDDLSSGNEELVMRAEIWGHASFDDHRLPALRLKSMRGICGLVAVRKVENLTPNWFYQHKAQSPEQEIDSHWPMLYFGGWSTTDEPSQGIYYQEVPFTAHLDTRALHFPGIQVSANVFLNGQKVELVNPFDPFIDISGFSRAGETSLIAVTVDQPFRRQAGEVWLYEGESVQEWEVAGWNENELADLARRTNHAGKIVNFPVSLNGGEMAWLHTELPLSADWERGVVLQLTGQGMKISTWLGSNLVGRIFLPSEMRPRMAGGADDRLILPAHWIREASGHLSLLVESVKPLGQLNSLKFILEQ